MNPDFPNGLSELSPQTLDTARNHLRELEEFVGDIEEQFGALSRHPWRGVMRPAMDLYDIEALADVAKAWAETLAVLEKIVVALRAAAGMTIDSCISSVTELSVMISRLPAWNDANDTAILAMLGDTHCRNQIVDFRDSVQAFRTKHAKLANHLRSPLTQDASELAAMAREAGDLAVAKKVSASLTAEITQLTERADALTNLAAYGHRFAQAVGYSEPLTLTTLKRLLSAAESAAVADRQLIVMRTAILMADASATVLARGRTAANDLANRLRTIALRFDLTSAPEPAQLISHAATLRAAGMFGRIRRGYRAAKYSWRSLSRNPVKTPPATMAEDLMAISQFISDRKAFEDDVQLRTVCGAEFRGIETDFLGLIAVNEFAAGTRRAFAGADSITRCIRAAMIDGDIETVDALINAFRQDDGQLLRILGTLAAQTDIASNQPLESLAAGFRARATRLSNLLSRTRAANLASDTEIGNSDLSVRSKSS